MARSCARPRHRNDKAAKGCMNDDTLATRTPQSASIQGEDMRNGGPRSVVAAVPTAQTRPGVSLLPSRKAPAHHPIREMNNRSPLVFLTVCSQDRRAIFDKPDIHELMKSSWTVANAWNIGRYVLMPDHIHLFCAPNGFAAPSLDRWVQFWKSLASRRWPRLAEQPVWQKSFWDTQIREGESYNEKWEYVRRNPVRANLCVEPEEWPFQGEMNNLMWHD